jgi:hypothetical protein
MLDIGFIFKSTPPLHTEKGLQFFWIILIILFIIECSSPYDYIFSHHLWKHYSIPYIIINLTFFPFESILISEFLTRTPREYI